MIIQDDLVTLAAERRLIPFIGAGFSASLGLPSWESMLRGVSAASDGSLPFDDVMRSTGGDLLQVAEYLYLHHDRQIGPIRHQIEKSFSSRKHRPLESAAHVELANLGAGQIYTTNYDDILEQTHREMGLPFSPVILPKDVALADPDKTQIVKYHGDLAHERTLVLTESAYYKRLDFESPMDLKFRSDLLGKSVLFMGYSFRDVNVRIIWFKLMDMMRDIPEADRRPSYIVRFEPDAALEKLYGAVGLKTIVLNPKGDPTSPAQKADLLGRFLMSLSLRAGTSVRRHEGVGTGEGAVFVSSALLEAATRMADSRYPGGRARSYRLFGVITEEDPILARLLTAEVPAVLQERWEVCVGQILPALPYTKVVGGALKRLNDSSAVSEYVLQVLRQNGVEEARANKRELLVDEGIDWARVWSAHHKEETIVDLLDDFARELQFQAYEGADEDIAYFACLARRIADGDFIETPQSAEGATTVKALEERAELLLSETAKIYPSARDLSVDRNAPPRVERMLEEVAVRTMDFKPVEIDSSRVTDLLADVGARTYRTLISRAQHEFGGGV